MGRWRAVQGWALLALLFALVSPALAQRDEGRGERGQRGDERGQRGDERGDRNWKLLGWRGVGFSPDPEVIEVGRRQGRFEKIRLRARGNDIFVMEVRVVYENGEDQDFRVRQRIEEGESTAPIDLARGGRFIDRVEVRARSRPSLRQRAVIEVYGEEGRRGDGPGDDWELVGSTVVGFTLDTDRIDIGRRPGGYRNLRFRARGDDIYVRDFTVTYARGGDDDVRVGESIREGELSRPFNIDDEPIRDIEVTARSRPGLRRRAVLEVYGEKRRGPPEGRWEELGCQKVGFLADRDVIRVGREEGRLRAIQLRASGNSVFLQDLRLVYSDGTVDDYRVSAEIPEGGQTRPIDLRGKRRFLDRIIMIYRARPNFRGSARLCVYARE